MLPDFLKRRPVRLVLAVISIISFIGYAFPLVTVSYPDLKMSWIYHYTETLFSNRSLVYKFDADWGYQVVSSHGDVLVVKVNGTSRHRYFFENGSWASFNWTDLSWFFVNAKTRMYSQGYYTSWWIPPKVYLGDTVPVWNLDLRVVGLAWTMINGQLLECWVLRYERPMEEYTFLYERTTGFFVRLIFKKIIGKSQIVAERMITKTSFRWPILASVRPFLVLIAVAAIVFLTASYIDDLRRLLRRTERIPIII
jgi:hypothetical protein